MATHKPDSISEEIDEAYKKEIRGDLGANYDSIARGERFKRWVFEVMYHPRAEIVIFFLILASIILLVIEVSLPSDAHTKGGWIGAMTRGGERSWFFYLDVGFSAIFLVEYLTKLWIAPKKWFFVKSNWVDLLAIMPMLRIFRIGRALRLLRLFRLLRLIRIGQLMQQRVSVMGDDLQKRSAENLVIVVYLLFSLIFGTIGVLVFEKGQGSGFETLGDGLWWCVVTLTTVGYGDISPKTAGGKVVAVIIMFIGLSFYALLTGVLSSVIIERTRLQENPLLKLEKLAGHVIVCGWNKTGERLVTDLILSEQNYEIVVLCNESTYPKKLDPNIHYTDHDPTTAEGLEVVGVTRARVAVVLPDTTGGRSAQDADARSILTILAIEQLNPKIHSIVELFNEQNRFHVQNAGCDEVIVSNSYTGSMLSQAVKNPGVSEVFTDLFHEGDGTHIVERAVHTAEEGQAFSSLMATTFATGDGVLMGYRRGKVLHMSPGQGDVVQGGDALIFLARQGAGAR